MTVKTMPVAEFHATLRAQGVSAREHTAFVCVQCGNVQSIASLMLHGMAAEQAERRVGFSCEGRMTKDRGCDWTLGGLFTIHELEVITDDGKSHPTFLPATPEQAQALERDLATRGPCKRDGVDASATPAAAAE